MGNFIEDFFAGKQDPQTGEMSGGVAGLLDNIVPDPGTTASNIGHAILDYSPLTVQKRIAEGAIKGLDFADSYLLSRPVSTVSQATNLMSNPLYKDGIQWDDFRKMWNASEYITPGRALVANAGSYLNEFGKQSGISALSGDWNKFSYQNGYDPYANPQKTEEDWDKSPLGTLGSLSFDVAFQTIVGGKGVNMFAKGAKRAAGLATDIENARDLTKLSDSINSHLDFVDSGGTSGKQSVAGMHVMDLAKSNDYNLNYNNPLINAFSKLGSVRQIQLAHLSTKIDDPRLITDLILADKGDPRAVSRLFQQAPDHVWSLTDMNQSMRSKFMEGGQWHPQPDESRQIAQVFDSALERDAFWTTVKDTFMGQSDGLQSSVLRNSTTVPMQGPAGAAQRWLYRQIAAVRTGGGDPIAVIPLGGQNASAPITSLMQWIGGRKPLNMVSRSGMRPTETVEEMLAYTASSQTLRGNKTIQFVRPTQDGLPEVVTMSASSWRNDAMQRLGAAATMPNPDTAVAQAVREIEGEAISAHAMRFGIDPQTTQRIIDGLRESRDAAVESISREGFFMDDAHGRVMVDPVFRRQLADSITLIPLRQVEYQLRKASLLVPGGRKNIATVANTSANLADEVLKGFRTMALFKPGYVPKNSIFEPGLSALLSHGTILASDGLANSVGRFMVNRGRMMKQIGYSVADRGGISSMRANADTIAGLHMRRQMILHLLDMDNIHLSNGENGLLSPSQIAKFEGLTKNSRRSLSRELQGLESQLDGVDPIWREVQEVPFYSQLRGRVDDLNNVINRGPEYLEGLRRNRDGILARAEGRTVSESESLSSQIDRLQSQLDEINVKSKQLQDSYPDDVQVGEVNLGGGPADMTLKRSTARGRDYQGIALERQRQSITKQIDALVARRDEFNKSETVDRPTIYSGQEQSELNRLNALIDVAERYANGDLDLSGRLDVLRQKLDAIRDDIHTAQGTSLQKRVDLERELAAIDSRMGKIRVKRAKQLSKRERARERKLSGEGFFTLDKDGDIVVPRAFNEAEFGTAVRAESSSGLTTSLTLNPAEYGSAAASRWMRSGGVEAVAPSDPIYFDELAYIANRQVRNDKFATMLLEGRSNQEIKDWFRTPEGKGYLDDMGWQFDQLEPRVVGTKPARKLARTDAQDTSKNPKIRVYADGIIDENRQLLNAYFPDPKVRLRLLDEKDVKASELEQMMAERDDLSQVHAGNLKFKGNTWAGFTTVVNRGLNAVWRGLAANPESRFGRWPWLDRQFEANMRADVAFAQEMGQELTQELVDDLRQAAMARSLKDAENTFYNIRRYSDPAYAMRFITGFPGAYFNSIYRYLRLAYRNPGNAMVISNAWSDGLYKTFGVDREGNHTTDPTKVNAIAFTLPDPFAKSVAVDPDVRIGVQGWQFALQSPTAMPFLTVPVNAIIGMKPTANAWLKENFGDDWYTFLFPFGQPDTESTFKVGPVGLDPFFPGYAMDAVTMMNMMAQDRIQSVETTYKYLMWQYRNGLSDTKPKVEDAVSESNKFWMLRIAAKFMFSGGLKIDPLGQAQVNQWNEVLQQTNWDYDLAKKKYLEMYGTPSEIFMISTSRNRAGMPYTADAMERLDGTQELQNELRKLDPSNPKPFVSLLFGDTQGEYDRAIYDALSNRNISGETEPIRSKLDPYQFADEDQINQSWNQYNAAVANRDALMQQYGYKTLQPTGNSAWLYEQWHSQLDEFRADPANRQWVADFDESSRGVPGRVIQGMNMVLNDKQFARTYGKSPAYKVMREYLSERDRAVAQYEAAGDSGAREQIARDWDSYVRQWFAPANTSFATTYSSYLDNGRDLADKRLWE